MLGIYVLCGYFGMFAFTFSYLYIFRLVSKIKRKMKVDRFLKNYGNLSDPQKKIVLIYKYRWNYLLTYLIESVINGDTIIDFHEHIDIEIQKIKTMIKKLHGLKVFLPPGPLGTNLRMIARMKVTNLPTEIFKKDGTYLILNETNKEFIELFF